MDLVPIGPGFCAEVRGISLIDVASGDRCLSGDARGS